MDLLIFALLPVAVALAVIIIILRRRERSLRAPLPMTHVPREPERSALAPCPDCRHPLSPRAWFCPRCGRRILDTVTIQRTAKWLKVLVLASLMALAGGCLLVTAAIVEGGPGLSAGLVLLAGGFAAFVAARSLIWWYHG